MATKQNMSPGQNITGSTKTTVVGDNKGGSLFGQEETALETFGQQQETVQPFEDLSALSDTGVADITNDDRYFGARQPIQRGTSKSGVPIFVANQPLTPIGILDKKEKAVDEARRKRAARKAKFKLDEVERLKNANYQKSFDEGFVEMQNSYINEAKTLYGDDWDLYLGSDESELGRRYKQSLSNFKTLKTQADAFTDRAADIKSRIEAGDASVSEKTADMVKEVEGAIGQFSEGNPVDLVGKMDQLNASVNIDSWLNDNIFPHLEVLTIKHTSGLLSDDDYKTQVVTETRRIAAQAREEAKRLKKSNGVFGWDENITEDDIYDAITQRIGNYTASRTKVADKPGKNKNKYTPEDLSNRLVKLNTLNDAFSGGSSDVPSDEAQAISDELVNKKYNGRIIKGSEIIKGEENQDLVNNIKSVFSYYQKVDDPRSHKSSIEKSIKARGKSLEGSKYDDGDVSGTVKSVNFSEVEKDGQKKYGVATVSVETPEGVKTVEYPLTKDYATDVSKGGKGGFSKMRDAFKAQYPDSNDRVELSLIPSRENDRLAAKPVVLDLTDDGVKWVINDIINTAEGGVDIPTEHMQMREKGVEVGADQVGSGTDKKGDDTTKKDEKDVSSDLPKLTSELKAEYKKKNYEAVLIDGVIVVKDSKGNVIGKYSR